MGKDKPSVIDSLRFLVNSGFDVVRVIGPVDNGHMHNEIKLNQIAKDLGIKTTSDEKLYDDILNDPKSIGEIDLVISFLFWKKIKKPLIQLPKIGCINFHSAPLPDFRGVNGYSFGIWKNLDHWGVSAHMVDESFDTGEIIKVKKFEMNPKEETAFSLEQKSQAELFLLFKEVILQINNNKKIETYPQISGSYYSMEDFERLRHINENDTVEDIDRKIRAFWYPAYDGACVTLRGKEFTVINKKLLKEIKDLYWRFLEKKTNGF